MIVDINTYSDADFIQSFLYKTVALTSIDLLDYPLRMMVRVNPADVTTWIECSTWNGRIVITDHLGGAFTLTIPIAVLATLPVGVYNHSLIQTQASPLSVTPAGVPLATAFRKGIWRGTLTHSAGPTRWQLGGL
jgi:hypothetical protein